MSWLKRFSRKERLEDKAMAIQKAKDKAKEGAEEDVQAATQLTRTLAAPTEHWSGAYQAAEQQQIQQAQQEAIMQQQADIRQIATRQGQLYNIQSQPLSYGYQGLSQQVIFDAERFAEASRQAERSIQNQIVFGQSTPIFWRSRSTIPSYSGEEVSSGAAIAQGTIQSAVSYSHPWGRLSFVEMLTTETKMVKERPKAKKLNLPEWF